VPTPITSRFATRTPTCRVTRPSRHSTSSHVQHTKPFEHDPRRPISTLHTRDTNSPLYHEPPFPHQRRSQSGNSQSTHSLSDLDTQLAKVLLVEHVLVRVFEVSQIKDLVIDDGMNVVLLDGGIHGFELETRADEDAADSALVA
jgi:hypothetical protein